VLRRLRLEARAFDVRTLVRTMVQKYRACDLLTYASAISFRVLFALIPLLLFAIGLLGFLSLQEAWAKDIAPAIEPHVSDSMFQVINDTVNQVLGSEKVFWVSLGAALAVWEISAAVRAVMQVFNRIYGVQETRPFWRRMRMSIALAAVAGLMFLAAAVIVRFGPLAVDALGAGGLLIDLVAFVARWAVALALLIAVVGLMVRFAPDCRRPLHWVSFGALVVVFGWAVMSTGFYIYATEIADYGSIFGSLAMVIVTMTYIYASVIVFLTGVQLDALVQDGIAARETQTETGDRGSSVRSGGWPDRSETSPEESSPSPARPVASG
jgi:membrane protein